MRLCLLAALCAFLALSAHAKLDERPSGTNNLDEEFEGSGDIDIGSGDEDEFEGSGDSEDDDVDEEDEHSGELACSDSLEICVESATCSDVDGAAFCTCPPGSKGDGFLGLEATGCRYMDCPPGMSLLVETLTCIAIVPNNDTTIEHHDARWRCYQDYGSELASIANFQALNLTQMYSAANGLYGDFWIGLNDIDFEGEHVWPDHTVPDYMIWDEGEPSEPTQTKDCVTIQLGQTFKYKSQECDYAAHGYLCSRSLIPPPICPQGWYALLGKCYHVSVDPSNYMEAYMTCARSGGDLLSFTNAANENDLAVELNLNLADFWIGLQDGFTTIADDIFQWTDTMPLSYTNWGVGEPESQAPNDRCVYRNNIGRWVTADCQEDSFHYVCVKEKGIDRVCPMNTARFGEKCYKHDPGNRLPWMDTHQYCLSMGGDLLTITTPGEQALLAKYLTAMGLVTDYWIGLREDGNNNFMWTDQTPVYYTNWVDDVFDADPNTCTRMVGNSNFAWNDDPNCEAEIPIICEFTNVRCTQDSQCNELAECYKGQCRCTSGFMGDGLITCNDIDECLDDPCNLYASCTNTIGSFMCKCDPGYAGNGFHCENVNACIGTSDCHVEAICNATGVCQCNEGYEGNGKNECRDVNECTGVNLCDPNANCDNTAGSYLCYCIDGYWGDGFLCETTPVSCHAILLNDPDTVKNGEFIIDPDGPSGVKQFTVICEFINGYGITIISHTKTNKKCVPPNKGPYQYQFWITYKYQTSMAQAKALVAISPFCSQYVQYWANEGIDFLSNNKWVTAGGLDRHNWGGAMGDEECLCGSINGCNNIGSQCNSDGSRGQTDFGYITNKDDLPIQSAYFGGTGSSSCGAQFQIFELKCAVINFNIPLHCHDAKTNHNMGTNGAYLIDIDGPSGDEDGNLPPFPVMCDMTSYPNTGVTIIPHDDGCNDGTLVTLDNPTNTSHPHAEFVCIHRGEQEVVEIGVYTIVYYISWIYIQKVISVLGWCSQSITYTCQNSRLLANGEFYTYWSDVNGNQMNYWGSSVGFENSCACGVIGTCPDDHLCSCDMNDDVLRSDVGLITEKTHLPIGSFTLNDVGEGKIGKYGAGYLQCGIEQFGIPPVCQGWTDRSYTDTNPRLVDPDGACPHDATEEEAAANIDPFLVECQSTGIGQGITIIYPGDGDCMDFNGEETVQITYPNTTPEQIAALVDRSTSCYQEITYGCNESPIHGADGVNVAWWGSADNTQRFYFDGEDGTACQCSSVAGNNTCEGAGACNCDAGDAVNREDSGILQNKDHLPVVAVHGGVGGSSQICLGPLVCTELRPTCYHLYTQYETLRDEHPLSDGYFVIDPGMGDSGDPIRVRCDFPLYTIISPKDNGNDEIIYVDGHTELGTENGVCETISYGVPLEQFHSLTEISGFCQQYAKYKCQNSPLSTHGSWWDRDGVQMPGWPGNNNLDECGCGETDTCIGGSDTACDCDQLDGVERYDHGLAIHKEHLPISKVCMGVSTTAEGDKMAGYIVNDLKCTPWQVDIPRDCQERRNFNNMNADFTETWLVDPDGQSEGSNPPFPAHCEMIHSPPIGITVITQTLTGCVDVPTTETEMQIEYNSVDDAQIRGLTGWSSYCAQDLSYQCTNADLQLDATYGWKSLEGNVIPYWGANTDGTGCTGGQCQCANQDGNQYSDEGPLFDKDVLPVKKVNMAAVGDDGIRCLDVAPLKCYSLYRHCHEILISNAMFNPLNNGSYAIDPDQAGGVEAFQVTCDFTTQQGIGITEIPVENDSEFENQEGLNPGQKEEIISYYHVTIEQAKALFAIQDYCTQKMVYECRASFLLNDDDPAYAFFKDSNGTSKALWSGYDLPGGLDAIGCACQIYGTCPDGKTCRCDALAEEDKVEEGDIITNTDLMPITSLMAGGAGGSATIDYGPPKCSVEPFEIPRGCEDARQKGIYSKEIWALPHRSMLPDNGPMFVRCDHELYPGKAVTVLQIVDEGTTFEFTGGAAQEIDGPLSVMNNLVQMSTMVGQSENKFCYWPIKTTVKNIVISEELAWKNRAGSKRTYWGHANTQPYSSLSQCSCGFDQKCAGDDGRPAQMARNCNGDIGDDVWRVDAGIYNVGIWEIPFQRVMFNPVRDDAHVIIEFGDIYCSPYQMDLDECEMGFNDCHENATCINQPYKYDCECKVGWQALGHPDLWANGRVCYDDDECALQICPITATCENTPGSFICNCNEGFRKTGETTCEDINECEEGTDGCDENASCFNTKGGYLCMCKDGFRGDGFTCVEFGTCMCYGDPHCLSFDRKWNHFMGACTYTLYQDGCVDGYPSEEPATQVLAKYWRDYITTTAPVSWVKEVIILYDEYEIKLMQQREVRVNGNKVLRLPAYINGPEGKITIKYTGTFVHVILSNSVEVKFTGSTKVEVGVPGDRQGSMCGMCGDYNLEPSNDYTVGPACDNHNPGSVTENMNTFGHSWTNLLYPDEDDKCNIDCDAPPTPACDEQSTEMAQDICSNLNDPNGKFADCLYLFVGDAVAEMEERLMSCEYDLCNVDSEYRMPLYCDHAQDLMQRCSDLGVQLDDWRSESLCPITCGDGEVYSACGNPCEPTCSDDENEQTVCTELCMEGCYCDDGLVRDGNRCVPSDQCGCSVMEGDITVYYQAGDRIVTESCETECVCNAETREMDCNELVCNEHGHCDNIEGVTDCYCDEGFTGNGVNCTDINECEEALDDCNEHAICVNTVGNYTCECTAGYEANRADFDPITRESDGWVCDDIDECTTQTDQCDHDTTDCKNTDGAYECPCLEGYNNPTGSSCDDIDECATNRDACERTSTTCENQDGGYQCNCRTGYVENDYDNTQCDDVDECTDSSLNNCAENSTCSNNAGSFSCTCDEGFTGDGTECDDVDECIIGSTNDCAPSASDCTNSVGSYSCSCHDGYEGDGEDCDDINECSDHPQSTNCVFWEGNGYCNNTQGGFNCGCNTGYYGDGTTDGSGCDDIDECEKTPWICGSNSICHNSDGSFSCTCEAEQFSTTDDGANCTPIPTCDNEIDECGDNTICVDTGLHTGPVCECLTGFNPINDPIHDCEDVDECEDVTKCNGDQVTCTNTAGSYSCGCTEGYVMNNGGCDDFNECDNEADTCDDVSEDCTNTDGSFICKCKDGFVTVDNADGTQTCEDTNECADDNLVQCSAFADCNNNPGSYECVCQEGYQGNGVTCDDVPECSDPDGNRCAEYALCEEAIGGYTCTCVEGYEGDGETCDDTNECDIGSHNCVDNAICTNTQGAFFCTCGNGFQGHCDWCMDEDECAAGLDNCHHNSECINTPGSFQCDCSEGYDGDGNDCADIDECKLGLHDCSGNNGGCVNTMGSFMCYCNVGYKMNVEGVCEDVNECNGTALCDIEAVCTNTPGSYDCECKEGFLGDGSICTNENPNACGDDTCDTFASCEDDGSGVEECHCKTGFSGAGELGPNGEHGCEPVDPCGETTACDSNAECYNVKGLAKCVCNLGFTGTGLSCTKDDACIPNPCAVGVDCTTNNETGLAQCVCEEGFVVHDDVHCDDIDECNADSENPIQCEENSRCQNTPGSYICQCDFGFTQSFVDGAITCTDVDDCLNDIDDCDPDNAVCTNTEGAYSCECAEGFIGDGRQCEETDMPGCDLDCPENEFCKNVDGQAEPHVCTCNSGYKRLTPGAECTDIDECSIPGFENECHTQATCHNMVPGFECDCNDGYQGNGYYCEDINECLDQHECAEDAVCTNSPGSYECECKEGFMGDGSYCELVPSGEDPCNCGQYGVCNVLTQRCTCKPGFKPDYTNTTAICQDADSCEDPHACHPAAICEDAFGGYFCDCPEGMTGDGKNYCDVDECELGLSNCAFQAICTNVEGWYTCECMQGYSGDGYTCNKDLTPCTNAHLECGNHTICLVTDDGHPTCQCEYGYEGDGTECTDTNECSLSAAHPCHEVGFCFNFEGGFSCSCPSGYRGNGYFCTDINECTENSNLCAGTAICHNLLGGYECMCRDGFQGDGFDCSEDGNCMLDDNCAEDASCTLLNSGAFKCLCDSGYEGSGYTCTDVDECADPEASDCSEDADCVNIAGFYECECKDGFTGNGFICNDINECDAEEFNDCEDGQECENEAGGYNCGCLPGYTMVETETGASCQNMDECSEDEWNDCHVHAECVDNTGSYSCTCAEGYTGDGVTHCDDIDECALGTADCEASDMCYNQPGGFTCGCLYGFLNGLDGCEDVDECGDDEDNECSSDADCTNTPGGYTCACAEGFVGNGVVCIDPTPCDQPGICDANAMCNIGDGGTPVCQCLPGWEMSVGTCSKQIDYCSFDILNECSADAECINDPLTGYGYICLCLNGWHGDGKTCDDNDECDPESPYGGGNACDGSRGQECVNAPPGGYGCTCGTGFGGDGGNCVDIDECSVETGGNECAEGATCHNRIHGYVCQCPEGYHGDGRVCRDINECKINLHMCGFGETCTNTEGSFECGCVEGFEKAADGSCQDIDECGQGADNPCGEGATCYNVQGSFVCLCDVGFEGDGQTCTDINECEDPDEHPCHENAECKNVPGGCTCNCAHGYEGDGIFCTEVDECPNSGLTGSCAPGTHCTGLNNEANQVCSCSNGQTGTGDFNCVGGICTEACNPINECDLADSPCGPNAVCTDLDNGYSCQCKDGFTGNGMYCHDVNECVLDEDNCAESCAECVNTEGSFECRIVDGFIGNGQTCMDQDECQTGNNECSDDATCVNNLGSYQCTCNEGFEGNGVDCDDVDECTDDSDLCHFMADCTNTPGSYECSCPDGFVGDGFDCDDIDECVTSQCGANALCHNLPGSVLCICFEGFEEDANGDCVDIDECVEDTDDCDDTADCVNTPGEFMCECEHGYVKVAEVCEDINECLPADGDGASIACGPGGTCMNTPGSCLCACPEFQAPPNDEECAPCEDIDECTSVLYPHDCDHRFADCVNKDPKWDCECSEGWEGDGRVCTDIDECAADETLCDPGECINTPGNYICECPDGYEFKNGDCEDINECEQEDASAWADECKHAECTNLEPGYSCTCLEGYTPVADSDTECEDINECEEDPTLCSGEGEVECRNTPGSYKCECTDTRKWNGEKCIDIDECEETEDRICGNPTTVSCTNTDGGFKCSCKEGYVLKNDVCVDVNECQETEGICGVSLCVNIDGSYLCTCDEGFKQVNNSCIDINECFGTFEDTPCDHNAVCINEEGSFMCLCLTGYIGDGFSCSAVCDDDTCPGIQKCTASAENTPQCTCVCEGTECLQVGRVCGTDGITYASDAEMFQSACNRGLDVERNYRGLCVDDCEDVTCTGFRLCEMREDVSNPFCVCPECDDVEDDPICSLNSLTWASECVMQRHVCLTDETDQVFHSGPCNDTECEYSQWTAWSPCDISCGSLERERTRNSIGPEFADGKACNDTLQNKMCVKDPCPGSPCAAIFCPRPHSRCVLHANTATCRCPDCTGEDVSKVCGIIDAVAGQQTFNSMCAMENAACSANTEFTMLSAGPCPEEQVEPIECSMVPEMLIITRDDGWHSRDEIAANRCGGGCDNLDLCCQPSVVEYQIEPFELDTDVNNDWRMETVPIVKECACLTPEQVMAQEEMTNAILAMDKK